MDGMHQAICLVSAYALGCRGFLFVVEKEVLLKQLEDGLVWLNLPTASLVVEGLKLFLSCSNSTRCR